MARRLSDNLCSLYIGASNRLRPKKARKKIVVYVEGYDDIMFWRNILSVYETESVYFEVMLPSRDSLTKGKKQAMMNTLGQTLGQNMIACVDADYDYLLQGATSTSKKMCESPYVFHTYAYAIENYQCNAATLHEVCVMSTLNDHEMINFEEFFRIYSQITYPLFVWNVYFYRKNDLRTFPIMEFAHVARLSHVDVLQLEHCLMELEGRVNRKLNYLEHQFSECKEEIETLKVEMTHLGVRPENAYYFMQGHHIFENVTLKLLTPVCALLRKEREDEIRALAGHDCQMQNELNSYQHSQSSVDLMLKKNRSILNCEPFNRLKSDLEQFLAKI
ncbi:MAG: DUF4435 domain-containing protein [Bacteroidaceae bacterium]|nr:DUF4435 domain-containing protein [Bacteroidaceae bacterium]